MKIGVPKEIKNREQKNWLVRPLMRTAFIAPEVVKPLQPVCPF